MILQRVVKQLGLRRSWPTLIVGSALCGLIVATASTLILQTLNIHVDPALNGIIGGMAGGLFAGSLPQ